MVIDDQDRVDRVATQRLRAQCRDANRDGSRNVTKLAGPLAMRVTDNLDLRRERSGLRFACCKCAADLGGVDVNYKDQCVRREADMSAANPNIGDYRRYIDDRPVFRQFFCPGCGALIENEVAREDDDLLRDIEISRVRDDLQ